MSDSSARSHRRWFSSLYWRIALGFIVLLAIMLAAQAASFVWIAVQTEQGQPERVGQDFAELVAGEFEAALQRDPSLDLKAYAASRLAGFHRPAFVTFTHGPALAHSCAVRVSSGKRVEPTAAPFNLTSLKSAA